MFGGTAALAWARDLLSEISRVHTAGSCLVVLEVCFVGLLLVVATAAAFSLPPIEEQLCERGLGLFDERLVYFVLMFLAGAALNCREFFSIPLL
mmetsp:Transcript_11701/g.31751  ORF Transcript_11701/g.31751 Transcript_11701/m.31751 type:complete len:94 (-) Transcript_11701:284-565(-)